jgi:hypothetical protein
VSQKCPASGRSTAASDRPAADWLDEYFAVDVRIGSTYRKALFWTYSWIADRSRSGRGPSWAMPRTSTAWHPNIGSMTTSEVGRVPLALKTAWCSERSRSFVLSGRTATTCCPGGAAQMDQCPNAVDRTPLPVRSAILRTPFGAKQRAAAPEPLTCRFDSPPDRDTSLRRGSVQAPFRELTLKAPSKGEHVLRFEVIVHITQQFGPGPVLNHFPTIIGRSPAWSAGCPRLRLRRSHLHPRSVARSAPHTSLPPPGHDKVAASATSCRSSFCIGA